MLDMSVGMAMLLSHLVNQGIEITIRKGVTNEHNGVYFDLNTHAKSQVHLYDKEGKIYAAMRYGRTEAVDTLEDVYRLVKSAMCGRDYISAEWAKLLKLA